MVKKVKFKTIFDFCSKSKIKASEGLLNGDFPFYTSSQNLSKFINEANFRDTEALIFGTGGLASIHYANTNFSTSTDCFVTKLKNNDFFLKYIYYYLSGNIYILENGFKGAGLKHISKKYMEDIEIPFTSFEKQKLIAKTLDKANELIELRKESITKLDALAKSIFIDMFGDPLHNPKKWDIKKIADLGKVQTGNTPPRADLDNYGNFIEWIKSDNILKDKIIVAVSKEYLSEKGYKKGRVAKKGSLLFTCIAGSMSSIGNLAITDREVTFNQQINSLTPVSNNELYLYSLFKLSKKFFEENSTKSMKIMINKTTFENLLFPIAPLDLQNKFAKIIEKIEEQKSLYTQELEKLQENFDALLQKSFQ